jgi:predicted porin
VKLGRRLDAIYDNDWRFDPWANFDRVASPAWDLWHVEFASDPHGDGGTPEYGRLDHGVFYDSPSFGGVSLHLSGSPQKQAGDTDLPVAGALLVDRESLVAIAAHGRNSEGATDSFFGLKGRFADVELMGASDVSQAGATKARASTLGATWNAGAMTWKLGWGRLVVDGQRAERLVGAGVVHPLSKRTSLYLDLARKTFPTGAASAFGVGAVHSF